MASAVLTNVSDGWRAAHVSTGAQFPERSRPAPCLECRIGEDAPYNAKRDGWPSHVLLLQTSQTENVQTKMSYLQISRHAESLLMPPSLREADFPSQCLLYKHLEKWETHGCAFGESSEALSRLLVEAPKTAVCLSLLDPGSLLKRAADFPARTLRTAGAKTVTCQLPWRIKAVIREAVNF